MRPSGQQGLRLCDFLQQHEQDIVAAWERAFRAALAPGDFLPEPLLRDHIPDLLARIGAVVRTVHEGPPSSLGDLPERHALHRLASGYDLRTAAGELSVLRDVVLELWEPHVSGLSPDAVVKETRRFNRTVDAVIAKSVGTPSRKFVFRLVRKDGAVRWVSFNASAEPGADYLVAVGRDVTEERERSEFERQLIGIVSHDLRNPLHTVVMAAAVLAQRGGLDQGALDSVKRIHAAGERAVALIADLLDFTQARTAGGISLKPEPVNLHALVREAAAEVQAMYPGRLLEFEQHGRGYGTWDPARLSQVLENLLSNAFKYGAGDVPVTVRTAGVDGWVRLEVHNAGKPIASDLLPHLFEPLRQGRRTGGIGAVAGVGLGLYIVDHIVRAHGGKIQVHSTYGEGTTFTVHLPREPVVRAEAGAAP